MTDLSQAQVPQPVFPQPHPMARRWRLRGIGAVAILAICSALRLAVQAQPKPTMLTDPFLQRPTSDSVGVIWFTEFGGQEHWLHYGPDLGQEARAQTTRIDRLLDGRQDPPQPRPVWRHEATATGLTPGVRVPYFVRSITEQDQRIASPTFTLQPLPPTDQPLKILLTSDHQLMPNTHINLSKVVETVGAVDAVFLAGDLVNIPDRWEEWFARTPRGIGFFPALQGRALGFSPKLGYRGGEILQGAHLFTALGNHEVMGRVDPDTGIADYPNKQPRWFAEIRYQQLAEQINPEGDPQIREQWIQDHSWNTAAYEQIFSLPDEGPGGKRYYSQSYGNVFLISLFATRPWRLPGLEAPTGGKYHEGPDHLASPERWTFGDFLYEPYGKGSEQYTWLVDRLGSAEFQSARYSLVMSHQISGGMGDNAVPLLTDPIVTFEYRNPEAENGVVQRQITFPFTAEEWSRSVQPILPTLTAIRYDYPRDRDAWHLEILPLLETAGVDLIHHGHSHLWYRSQTPGGVHVMETSNVGNSYGAYLEGYKSRSNFPDDPDHYDPDNYVPHGDPYGLTPIVPTLFSPMSHAGSLLPTVDSNEMTVFTILETDSGQVSSYVVDLNEPDHPVRLFDQFRLSGAPSP